MSENVCVVIDNGSDKNRAGFSGEDNPKVIQPTIIGRPLLSSIMVGTDQKQSYIGNEVEKRRSVLTVRRPIENGVIVDWDDMIKFWHHIYYNDLKMSPEQHPSLLTERTNTLKKHQTTLR
jgi:actin